LINNINYLEVKNCIVSELHLRENTSNIDLTPNSKTWQYDTFLLAKFLGDLECGNISLGGLPITNFKIIKRRVDSTVFQDLGTIPFDSENESFQFIDTSVRPKISYEYRVLPMSNDITGQPILVQITVDFDYWWLSDATGTTNESYPFFANLEVSDIQVNKQRYVYDNTFNEFPVVSYGNQQYQSATINAYLLDAFMDVSVAYRNAVIKFISNGKPKYLKNNLGDLWKVDTFINSYKMLTSLVEPVSTISFSFIEIEKVLV
jgi:hypothetical protein